MRRACHSSELTNHALISQKQTKFFHPFTVHAKIAMAETRCRAHSDYALNRTQVKLDIVDKTENRVLHSAWRYSSVSLTIRVRGRLATAARAVRQPSVEGTAS